MTTHQKYRSGAVALVVIGVLSAAGCGGTSNTQSKIATFSRTGNGETGPIPASDLWKAKITWSCPANDSLTLSSRFNNEIRALGTWPSLSQNILQGRGSETAIETTHSDNTGTQYIAVSDSEYDGQQALCSWKIALEY